MSLFEVYFFQLTRHVSEDFGKKNEVIFPFFFAEGRILLLVVVVAELPVRSRPTNCTAARELVALALLTMKGRRRKSRQRHYFYYLVVSES